MTSLRDALKAHDSLLAHLPDYGTAMRASRWPQLSELNWALDDSDVMAAGNTRPTSRVVDELRTEQKRSFAGMSLHSSRVASYGCLAPCAGAGRRISLQEMDHEEQPR
jgi:hypothetical protein